MDMMSGIHRGAIAVVCTLLATNVMAAEVTPARYLQSQPPPHHKPGHRLLPVSLAPGWAHNMPFDVRVELANRWGHGLFFGVVSQDTVDKAINDPTSVYYQVLQLAKSDPARYPLDMQLKTQNYFTGEQYVVSRAATPEAYLQDGSGNFILSGTTPLASPETPDAIWNAVVADLTEPLQTLAAQGVRFNVIQHWSEWFFGVWGFGAAQFQADPKVVAAKEAMVGPGNDADTSVHPHYNKWNKYLHTRRAYYEGVLANAVKAIATQRNSYNWYGFGGGEHYGRYGWYDDWQSFQFTEAGAKDIVDYPGSSLYRPDTGNLLNGAPNYANQVNDILSLAIAAKGVEIAAGVPLNQSWIWIREDGFAEYPRFKGLVRCLYVLGQVGYIHFLMPESGSGYRYDPPIDPASPPTWLQQVEGFSRIHAQFTHFDDFLYEGNLVEGPYRHVFWEQYGNWDLDPNPGYVLDNPYEVMRDSGKWQVTHAGEVRIVARQKANGELLICAWAADGTTREVATTLPGGAQVQLVATPEGTLYFGDGDALTRVDGCHSNGEPCPEDTACDESRDTCVPSTRPDGGTVSSSSSLVPASSTFGSTSHAPVSSSGTNSLSATSSASNATASSSSTASSGANPSSAGSGVAPASSSRAPVSSSSSAPASGANPSSSGSGFAPTSTGSAQGATPGADDDDTDSKTSGCTCGGSLGSPRSGLAWLLVTALALLAWHPRRWGRSP